MAVNVIKVREAQLFNPGVGGTAIYGLYRYMCRCEGYGFQAVYSSIGYINQSVWL